MTTQKIDIGETLRKYDLMLERAIKESNKASQGWFGIYASTSGFEPGGVQVSKGRITNISGSDLNALEHNLKKQQGILGDFYKIEKEGEYIKSGKLVFDEKACTDYFESMLKLKNFCDNLN